VVEKLKKYDVGLVAGFFGETLENKESSDGEFFKVEDVEPILNSLQQLKAEILPLCAKGVRLYNEGETQGLDSLFERIAAKLSAV
jgi:hypothetical protein